MITIKTAVAVRRAIAKLYDIEVAIKWVNDLYYRGKKVCGILSEAISDFESGMIEAIIIGIGINVSTDNFPLEIASIATSLGLQEANRNQFIAEILNQLFAIIDEDFKLVLNEYRMASCVLHKQITFNQKGEQFTGLVRGILLGSKLGALAVLLYVVIGLLGLPIFAAGGGLAYIVRPSFGYLIGFIAGAYVTGIICEKTNEIAAKKYVLAVLSGLLATYMIGLGYKYIILNYYTGTPITWKLVLLSCFPLDLPGDLFLSFLAVGTGIRFEKIFKKRRIQC